MGDHELFDGFAVAGVVPVVVQPEFYKVFICSEESFGFLEYWIGILGLA
jgi:hypothetical protein